jgi:hypothetical protein
MPTRATTPATTDQDEPTGIESSDTQAADAALAYDAWFRSEVEAGLREADDPNTVWVSNEEVERETGEQRARWLARIEKQSKSA